MKSLSIIVAACRGRCSSIGRFRVGNSLDHYAAEDCDSSQCTYDVEQTTLFVSINDSRFELNLHTRSTACDTTYRLHSASLRHCIKHRKMNSRNNKSDASIRAFVSRLNSMGSVQQKGNGERMIRFQAEKIKIFYTKLTSSFSGSSRWLY